MHYGSSFPNASDSFRKANPNVFKKGNGAAKVQASALAMNTYEAKFAMKLEADKREGLIEDWKFEAIRLRLADRTTYTPDFLVIKNETTRLDDHVSLRHAVIRFIEIKGFRRDDAMVKFKIARELYPWAEFEMWTLTKNAWKWVM